MSRPKSRPTPGQPKGGRAVSSLTPQPIQCPFKIIRDSREQTEYRFAGIVDDAGEVEADGYEFSDIRADADLKYAPMIVQTVKTGLPRGDYSVLGCPGMVAERKSLGDLYGSVSRRENFEHRLAEMTRLERVGFVIVEASWEQVLGAPPRHSKLNPKSLGRTIIAWEERFPFVHWKFFANREWAEKMTFRYLERWYRDHRLGMQDVTVLDQSTGKLVRSVPSPIEV
jgi:hypothetical protein